MKNELKRGDVLLTSDLAIQIFLDIREGRKVSFDDLKPLSPNDATYLASELCVRLTSYHRLEDLIRDGTSPWVVGLSLAFRDMFINPEKALKSVSRLTADCPDELNLRSRLEFWRIHLTLLSGRIAEGELLLNAANPGDDGTYPWFGEALAIISLGHYLAGRAILSLEHHRECQKFLDHDVDLFIQTFNCAMASRAALKLADAESFEFFSHQLERSLIEEDDNRYRLRHISYRAMILNQLGDHLAAERFWIQGDAMLDVTVSALEKGQYLTLRGMALALSGKRERCRAIFQSARSELINAGSPPAYLTELQISEQIAPIADLHARARSLASAMASVQFAMANLRASAALAGAPMSEALLQAANYCQTLITGDTIPDLSAESSKSLAISILINHEKSENFARGLSHVRLIPNFVQALEHEDLSQNGISRALEGSLKLRPVFELGEFRLPNKYRRLESSPDLAMTLGFGNLIYRLSQKAEKLVEAELKIQESQRAAFLLHDLRFFAMNLERLAKSSGLQKLSRTADQLKSLLNDYLNTLKSGKSVDVPTILEVNSVLGRISENAESFGDAKVVIVSDDAPLFLWTSEAYFGRLIENLFKNAVESSQSGEPVEVRISRTQTKLNICISNSGASLDSHVFERARSGHDVTSTKTAGHGLGLRSAFECARGIGAELRLVESRDKITTIEVAIPVQSTEYFGEPSIVVVDDAPEMIAAWSLWGKQNSKKVVALSPSPSLAAFLSEIPESVAWIVLDYNLKLPGTNGVDLARCLLNKNHKLALSSGFDVDSLPADASGFAWDKILTKDPQDPETAVGIVLPLAEILESTDSKELSSMRHSLRSELSPLKVISQYFKKSPPKDPKLIQVESMISGVVSSLERIASSPVPTLKVQP